MGADLTITATNRYFRDSYNPSNILWVLDLSYWDLDVILTKKGMLKNNILEVDGSKYMLKLLLESKITSKAIKQHLKKHKVTTLDADYFIIKYCDAVSFWNEAVTQGSKVRWSV